MSFFTSRTAFFTFWIASTSLPLAAQKPLPALDALLKRQVITAESAQQKIAFEHLIVGQTYSLHTPGGEPCIAQCMPTVSVLTPNTQILGYSSANQRVKFVASAPYMEFQLSYPCAWDPASPPRHYISLTKTTAPELQAPPTPDAVLSVTQKAVDYLVRDVLVGGNCYDNSRFKPIWNI